MIDLTKVEFTESPSNVHPESTTITGCLKLFVSEHVSNIEIEKSPDREDVKNLIKARIHRMTYGGLLPRIAELSATARKNTPPYESLRLDQLDSELNALLSTKFNPESEAPKSKLTEREAYWISGTLSVGKIF